MSRYAVNWKLLLGSLVAAAGLGAALHTAHARQTRTLAAVYRQQAEAAEAAGDAAKAVDFFRRYLTLRPDDTDARARMGVVMAAAAVLPQQRLNAYYALDEAVRGSPDRHDLRRKCIELALSLGPDYVRVAREHLAVLARRFETEGELDVLYADTFLLESRFPEAAKALDAAVAKSPDLFTAYTGRALLLREKLNSPDGADKIVEGMLKRPAAQKSADAQLAAAAYWDRAGRPADRAAALGSARTAAPDDLRVQLAVAQFAFEKAVELGAKGDATGRAAALAEARGVLRRGLELHAPTAPAEGEAPPVPATDTGRLQRLRVAGLFELLVSVEVQSADLGEAEAVARRGTQALPQNGQLAAALIDVQIRRGEADAAEKGVARLGETTFSPAALGYHAARVRALRADWAGAARALDDLVKDPAALGGLLAPAHFLAGACYEQIGELDRRFEHYRAAAGVDPREPLWFQATERLAATLAEMSRADEASSVYRRLAARSPAANAPLARLLLGRALAAPPGERSLKGVEEVVQRIPDGVEKDVLAAELLLAGGKTAEARDALTAAVARHPKDAAPVLALAVLEFRAGNPAKAAAALADARSRFGDSADARITEALFVPLPSPDGAAKLAALAEGADALPPADRARLLRRLSDLAAGAGANDLALRLRTRLAAVAPDDIGDHMARFDAAVAQNDEAAARAAVDAVRRLDGSDGSAARTADALFKIWRAQAGDKSIDLSELADQLAVVQRQRPWWPRVTLAQAVVADLRGDKGRAIARYRDAVTAGEGRPEVVRRLLELYAERQQVRDAADLLRSLPDRAGPPAGSELLVADLQIRAGNFKQALDAMSRVVSEDSKNPNELLTLAQLRRVNRVPAAEVERPIRKAVQLGGNLPGPWVALVLHLAETARRPEAEAAAEAAGRALTGPPRSLAVAQCLDILGEREKAGAAFRAAEQDNPTDLPTLRAAVEFFVRDEKPDRVRELCERILSVRSISDDDREFARKYIAMVLGTSRDADTRREALVRLGVLEGGVPTKLTGQETTDQLRTRALAFALQPDAALRREAIAALEAVDARRPLARQDEELLARLHTSVGDWESARKRLAKLAATHPDDLRYADALVFGLVRFQGSTKEARKYLDVLVKARPDTPRTVELAAHVLEAEGKTGEAVASLLAFAGKEPKHLPEVAAMVEQIGQEPRAEPLYRRLAADPARPDGPLVLAAYLGRLGRTDAALEVVRGVEGKFPPQALAAVGVGIVVASDRLSAERARLVQGWVAAIPPTPENRGLVLELTGILLTLQERYAEAAEVYREMVKLAPRDADHLNNLAFLLGVRGTDPDAGLEVLKRAKEVAGPRPNLLDTEGMILLAKGEARAAVRVLAAAAKESHDAAAYFHLALAHDRAGEKAEAANAIRVAQRLKIRPRSVLPAERADLERLLRWL